MWDLPRSRIKPVSPALAGELPFSAFRIAHLGYSSLFHLDSQQCSMFKSLHLSYHLLYGHISLHLPFIRTLVIMTFRAHLDHPRWLIPPRFLTITSAKYLLPYEVAFPGFSDYNLDMFGGHYLADHNVIHQ